MTAVLTTGRDRPVLRCTPHLFAPRAGICRDCHRTLCTRCRVPVARIGLLCVPCALVRAGWTRRLRARPRPWGEPLTIS